MLTSEPDFLRALQLHVRVSVSESNSHILDRAQSAVLAELASSTLTLREANRVIVELGRATTLLIDVTLSADLERILLCKLTEPDQASALYRVLQRAFEPKEEEDERTSPSPPATAAASAPAVREEDMDGPSMLTQLDANYVVEVKRAVQRRMETELNSFATPLENRAREDEARVVLLQRVLLEKYRACGVSLPRLELAPGLAAFPLPELPTDRLRFEVSGGIGGGGVDAAPAVVDAEFKRVLVSSMTALTQSRQDRKRQEVQARAEVCERNRFALVNTLAKSARAAEMDKSVVQRVLTGTSESKVVLCEMPCVYHKKPAFLLVLPTCLVVEHRVWGFSFAQCLVIEAKHCTSVHKVPPTLSVVESLCVRMDSSEANLEHFFYLASLLEDSTSQLDQVFELIWQMLRMNRGGGGGDAV